MIKPVRGFFDDMKLIFSPEGQKNIKAYKEKEKEEMLAVQKEILERYFHPSWATKHVKLFNLIATWYE